jgi:glutamine amidotransferase
MCRWAAYAGAPIFLEEIISRPGHSLIHQSHCATQCHSAINADGFGVAWYADRPEPGLYRDVMPAWSDPNLRSLTAQVRSGLFMAHVRASTGTATSRNNCHPFVHGQWSFMHNGQVGGYDQFRRDADMMIPDGLYGARKGATDSGRFSWSPSPKGWTAIRAALWSVPRPVSLRWPAPRAPCRICG